MSDNSKTLNINTNKGGLISVSTVIDFAEQPGDVGCHAVESYSPKYHKLVDAEIFVNDSLVGGNDTTISYGFDDIATEPDNILADSTIGGFTENANIAGIPVLGTAATHIDVGTADAQEAYEIKGTAVTAGKFTVTKLYKPYK